MCNRYVAPAAGDVERFWNLRPSQQSWLDSEVFPRAMGSFIRAAKASSQRELVLGRWGLIPWFAPDPNVKYATNNARTEDVPTKASYKQPWARAQRCIIPAISFDEPNWETGRNIWWRFRRADGNPWGLAGLWNTWVDKSTGELHESYTMLTLNADEHELMRCMHKPDPKLPPTAQDKRSVVPIDAGDVERWLFGSIDDAKQLIRLPPASAFDAGPRA